MLCRISCWAEYSKYYERKNAVIDKSTLYAQLPHNGPIKKKSATYWIMKSRLLQQNNTSET